MVRGFGFLPKFDFTAPLNALPDACSGCILTRLYFSVGSDLPIPLPEVICNFLEPGTLKDNVLLELYLKPMLLPLPAPPLLAPSAWNPN